MVECFCLVHKDTGSLNSHPCLYPGFKCIEKRSWVMKCQIPLGSKARTPPKYRKSWDSDLYPTTEARRFQLVIRFLTCPAVDWLWLLWEMRPQVYLEWVKQRSCCCVTSSVATGRAGNTVWKEVTQVLMFVTGGGFNWDNHTLLPRDLPHMTPVQLSGIQDVSQKRIWLCNFSSGIVKTTHELNT